MPPDPTKLAATRAAMSRVREFLAQEGETGWDTAWRAEITPWDAGTIQPPLADLIESGTLVLPKTGRALVPGCGRGYDAIFIATSTGLDTLAVEISESAIAAANELLEKSQLSDPAKVKFELQDFFALDPPSSEKFDLIFDHTFFVAIPPSRRDEWGQKMTDLVKPGGYLVTLVFPMDPPQDHGPPFFVRPDHYVKPLGDSWEKVVDKVPERSLESHVDREWLVVWRKL